MDDVVAAAEARFERAYRAWCVSKAFTEETLKEYHAAFDAVIRAKLIDAKVDKDGNGGSSIV